MISVVRLLASLMVLGGCAADASEQSEPAGATPTLAQVAWVGDRDWTVIGSTANSGPAICSWEVGRFDVFVRGADNKIWQRFWDQDTWSEWLDLGGSAISDPAAVSWGKGRIDLFVRGRDNRLYRKVFSAGKWTTDWENLGGTLGSSPAVTSSMSGRLDVFARGPDGVLWQKTFGTGWTDWKRVPGNLRLTSDPAATSSGSGRIDVVARGQDGHFNHITYANGAWGAWKTLGSNATSVTKPPTSFFGGFVTGAQDAWSRWMTDLGVNANAELTSAPGLTSWGPGRLDLFATDSAGTLWQRSFSNGAWGELVNLGGGITSAPDAVSWGEGQIDLVARDASNQILYRYYDGTW